MQQTLEEIESAILQLPEPARARLAKTLLLSLGGSEDSDAEELWAEEVEHRYREIEWRGDAPVLGGCSSRGPFTAEVTRIAWHPLADRVFILAVAHHKRRPYYWARRR